MTRSPTDSRDVTGTSRTNTANHAARDETIVQQEAANSTIAPPAQHQESGVLRPGQPSEQTTSSGAPQPATQNVPTTPIPSNYPYNSGMPLEEEPTPIDSLPPPAYSDTYGQISNDSAIGTNASIAEDGRVNIRINEKSRRLSQLFVPALRTQLDASEQMPAPPPPYIPPSLGGDPTKLPPPPMNVVIHVVGSRGDVQPFVALGKVLKNTYGHRVRLATHPVFQAFVAENGLEFFDIGGDPAELMAFMVKNPGLMPGFETLRNGEVGKKRKGIEQMIKGCWRSCIEAGDGTGLVVASDATAHSVGTGDAEGLDRPFVADAIIANPPSFAHVHCAEKLGVPLHMMFTMPWSPTQSFPHPLANVQSSNADASITNFMSYALVDMLTWQGLGDLINRFRVHDLALEPVSLIWAPGMLHRLRVPWTYCWSPALIPKPKDWGHNISLSGFYFLDLATNFTPEPDLDLFLHSGPPPVYIGFGSIVVDDPNAMTKLIFDAVVKSGQRALVSKGWGGFGADDIGIPEGVFMLGNVPHDWLFKRVSCVVHHGGAGTTAAGIACGKPTVIVPFFGDQPFWGAMVNKAGAGPPPIPYKQLNAESLAAAILEALKPSSLERAKEMATKISQEHGSDTGAQSFHQFLDVDKLRCAVVPEKAAVWRVKRTDVRLSALAATTLVMQNQLSFNDVKLYRSREYVTEDGPWDPLTGSASALMGTISGIMMGVADLPIETLKALQIHPGHKKSRSQSGNGEGSIAAAGSSSSSALVKQSSASSSSRETLSSTAPALRIGSHDNDSAILTPSESVDSASLRSPRSPIPRSGSTTPSASGAMADALRSAPTRSRSQSPHRTHCTLCRGNVNDEAHRESPGHCPNHFSVTAALGTGKGVSRIIGTGLKAPMDFSLGLARGFHNLPRLYGDDTVRQVDRIDSFQSGMKTVGKELGMGFYDGISGLVTQPLRGAKKEGFAGLIKGTGKGIAGLVVKPAAGIYGVPGYAFRGLYAEVQKLYGASVTNYIIAARTAQGYEEYQSTAEDHRRDIVNRWAYMKKDLKKKKNPVVDQFESIQAKAKDAKTKRKTMAKERRSSSGRGSGFLERLQHRRTESGSRSATPTLSGVEASEGHAGLGHSNTFPQLQHHSPGDTVRSPVTNPPPYAISSPPFSPTSPTHAPTRPPLDASNYDQLTPQQQSDLDAQDISLAIRESLSHASPTAEDDAQLERAIAVSMAELERARREGGGTEEDEEEAVKRAISASVVEMNVREGATEEERRELEEVLERSRVEHEGGRIGSARERGFGVGSGVGASAAGPSSAGIGGTRSVTGAGGMTRGVPGHEEDSDHWWSDDDSEDHEEELKRAIELSLKSADESSANEPNEHPAHQTTSTASTTQQQPLTHEATQETINESPGLHQISTSSAAAEDHHEADLKRALEASEREHREAQKARDEEEIVLEYVRKQSLLEAEHRDKVGAAGPK